MVKLPGLHATSGCPRCNDIYIYNIEFLTSYPSPSLFLLIRFLNLSGRPESRDLMRGGVGVPGEEGSLREDPVPEGSPLNLILYMHLRIFAYSSNILIPSFEPMDSMRASGTWKNFRFFLRSCSLREREPDIKLICSTCQPP